MHYLLLVYWNESNWNALPDSVREKVWEECSAYGRDLTASGHFLGGAPLQPVAAARTIRKTGGALAETDGPFAETKEVLAGYHLVKCEDIDEAMALGRRFPGLRIGAAIEVRPLLAERCDCDVRLKQK